jgi:hypothetical protein
MVIQSGHVEFETALNSRIQTPKEFLGFSFTFLLPTNEKNPDGKKKLRSFKIYDSNSFCLK